MVWICELNQHGQQYVNVSVWNTKQDAFIAACSHMMDNIMLEWDMSDPDTSKRAHLISDECAAKNWEVAVDLYNDWESGSVCGDAQMFLIYQTSIQTVVPSVVLLKPPGTPTLPAPPTIVFDTETIVPTAPKAVAQGATCRGPCKTFNEYAESDQSDGTYCCYQCRKSAP